MRTVKTASGALAVQIVWSARRGSRQIEHLGSAHDDAELEALNAAAGQRLAEGQGALDLGLDTTGVDGEPLQIVGSRSAISGSPVPRPTKRSDSIQRPVGRSSPDLVWHESRADQQGRLPADFIRDRRCPPFHSSDQLVLFAGMDATVYSSDGKRSPASVPPGLPGAAVGHLRGGYVRGPPRFPRLRLLPAAGRPPRQRQDRPGTAGPRSEGCVPCPLIS